MLQVLFKMIIVYSSIFLDNNNNNNASPNLNKSQFSLILLEIYCHCNFFFGFLPFPLHLSHSPSLPSSPHFPSMPSTSPLQPWGVARGGGRRSVIWSWLPLWHLMGISLVGSLSLASITSLPFSPLPLHFLSIPFTSFRYSLPSLFLHRLHSFNLLHFFPSSSHHNFSLRFDSAQPRGNNLVL